MLFNLRSICLVLFGLLAGTQVWSQKGDSLKLKNQDMIIGQIKSIDRAVLTIETEYSDKDFTIDFGEVEEMSIRRQCLVLLTRGRRRFGNVKSGGPGEVKMILANGTVENYKLQEIIALQEVASSFIQRFKASIDLGYNLTKANNASQFTIDGALNYTGEKWIMDGKISVLNSSQDDTEDVERTDASGELLRILGKKWFVLGNVSYLSNTEQALDGRVSTSAGGGYLLVTTNKLYLALSTGLTYTIENYSDDTLDKTSTELLTTLAFNMFDFKDFDLNTSAKFYPSLSEKGRVRLDYNIRIKYDLPLDFYIKSEFTLNFDNQPATSGSELDYIFTSGFGWEFN